MSGKQISYCSEHCSKLHLKSLYKICERCQKSDDLQLHHIRPLRFGGNNEKQNLMVLYRKCHMFWHKCFKSFWEKV